MTGTWPPGDDTGIELPVSPTELEQAGPAFLTRALRDYGSLSPDNSVRSVVMREVLGGSTGRKAMLTVVYDHPESGLPTDLFAKFSRDLTDPHRDRGRAQMQPEVRFSALAHHPDFPITVPRTVFADYHRETGTGLLVTERIPFGHHGIAPQHDKCLDYAITDATAHYRCVVDALARLAGWQRSGRAPEALVDQFPVDLRAVTAGEAPPLRREHLERQASRLVAFLTSSQGLFPEFEPGFLESLTTQIPHVVEQEAAVWHRLGADPDYIALCHWNANLDNAWFWRNDEGVPRCGLLDWGCVSRMNLAMALWGALSAAETSLWDDDFDALAALFVERYSASGGPALDTAELTHQVLIYAGLMGVTWLLDVPALLSVRLGDTARHMTRFDAAIRDHESVRAPLQMLTNVLNLWQTRDIGSLLAAPSARTVVGK